MKRGTVSKAGVKLAKLNRKGNKTVGLKSRSDMSYLIDQKAQI